MTVDEFWKIVGRVHSAAPGDMDAKCKFLKDELRQLQVEEVRSFGTHFVDFFRQAYKNEVWDAASLIKGGCGDDSFMDFRATLISLGREPFEAAMVNADFLANFNIDPAWATYQGYQYVAWEVYQEMGGKDGGGGRGHPSRPAGVACKEWEMSSRFPRLAAKYGHYDSDYLELKDQEEKRIRDKKTAREFGALMLEAGIIHSSGLIPPFRIVAQVLLTGCAPATTGRQHTWTPCKLEENIYWLALSQLEKIRPEQLNSRTDLKGTKLQLDVGAPQANDFDEWTKSLKQRGWA